MNLDTIRAVILSGDSSTAQLGEALDAFVQICTEVGGIEPDPGFDAWAGDSYLSGGVAIAPQAAAHCVRDYRRSVVFLQGIHAAIQDMLERFPDAPLRILYAGCGPYATLLLPLLGQFRSGDLDICLLDIHQESLASVERLLSHFDLDQYRVTMVEGDACNYRHPESLHLVITETMQKSLEQEPQFAVTAQLAPQLCAGGVFVPQKIEVSLCLLPCDHDQVRGDITEDGCELSQLLTLTPEEAASLLQSAVLQEDPRVLELPPTRLEIPQLDKLKDLEATLITRIQVYKQFRLGVGDAEITLPQRCTDLTPLRPGERWQITYELGTYPCFDVRRDRLDE